MLRQRTALRDNPAKLADKRCLRFVDCGLKATIAQAEDMVEAIEDHLVVGYADNSRKPRLRDRSAASSLDHYPADKGRTPRPYRS